MEGKIKLELNSSHLILQGWKRQGRRARRKGKPKRLRVETGSREERDGTGRVGDLDVTRGRGA